MDDMINRHDSIAEENIEPNGRPAKNELKNGALKLPIVQIMYSKVIRKTVPSRIVRNE